LPFARRTHRALWRRIKKYHLRGIAEDEAGNSLTFSLPLEGLNYEIPELEITEVHNRKGTAKDKSVPYPKEEFIEVLVRSDGNLAGLELFSADKNAAINILRKAKETLVTA